MDILNMAWMSSRSDLVPLHLFLYVNQLMFITIKIQSANNVAMCMHSYFFKSSCVVLRPKIYVCKYHIKNYLIISMNG